MNRRSFLTVGSLALGGLGLPNLEIEAGEKGIDSPAVIMLFLSGGMTHAESFVAKPDSKDAYRSVTGYTPTKGEFHLGGMWDKMANIGNLYNVVHSFTHVNADHQGGTHYVQTGYNQNGGQEGASQNHPSIGSIVSRTYGTNDIKTGMPSYVATGNSYGLKGSFLGSTYNPLVLTDEGKKNLELGIEMERFLQRKYVLDNLDKKFNVGIGKEIDLYKKQGYEMLLGKVRDAFELRGESKAVLEAYGPSELAKQAVLARRLVENGVKFVSIIHGGWDMHTDIKKGLEDKVPEVDHVLSVLFQDLKSRGMLDRVMVVATTEFGRTKINKDNGRDHYPGITPLLIGGAQWQEGRVIGGADSNGFAVADKQYNPVDLLTTILNHMNIDRKTRFTDLNGRPRYVVEGESKLIY